MGSGGVARSNIGASRAPAPGSNPGRSKFKYIHPHQNRQNLGYLAIFSLQPANCPLRAFSAIFEMFKPSSFALSNTSSSILMEVTLPFPISGSKCIDSWAARMEDLLRNTLIALIEAELTLDNLPRFLIDEDFRGNVLERVTHPIAKRYFQRFLIPYLLRLEKNGWNQH
jgi:hypothetical protein